MRLYPGPAAVVSAGDGTRIDQQDYVADHPILEEPVPDEEQDLSVAPAANPTTLQRYRPRIAQSCDRSDEHGAPPVFPEPRDRTLRGRPQFQNGADLSGELSHTTEHVDAVLLDVVQQVNRYSQPGQPNTVMPSR